MKSEVPALDAAIKIIELLSTQKFHMSTLSELSSALVINRSTCLRTLKVLSNNNIVTFYEDSKRYSLGFKLVLFGYRAYEQLDYLKISKPFLKQLTEETEMTSVLIKPSENNLIYIDKEEPDDLFHVSVTAGKEIPINAKTSFGKCFLAFSSPQRVNSIIQEVGVSQCTSKKNYSMEDLYVMFEEISQKGYAESNEECREGIYGVSSPIYDINGKVCLIVACIGFSSNITSESSSFYGEKVVEIGRKITEMISGITI